MRNDVTIWLVNIGLSGKPKEKCMKKASIAFALCVAMFLTAACGIINTLTCGGGPGTVSTLWADVPAFTGASKANLDLPLPAKLAVQGVFQGKLDFISYTTGSPMQDVQNFYSAERMQATGWNAESGGCTGNASANPLPQGAFCFFGKKEEGKDIGLAIVITQDDKTRQTQIFYVRIDVTTTPTPGK